MVKYWDKYTEMHGQQNVKKKSYYFQSVPVPVYRQVAFISFLAPILYTTQMNQCKNTSVGT